MSEMERASALLGMVSEYKLDYVIAYIQGLIADIATNQEDIPNAKTIAALRESDEMLYTGKGQRYGVLRYARLCRRLIVNIDRSFRI